ncbi:holo-ACP synthase [Veillonella criceti]|uniref:Holo-[acyl-carrier-protein] synthase n=1 Tax=Veillonella criceti TaxID=103891 RepID=A0A380NHV8_9FIRM|nr:holo-ACP synthase [Veillonella criceti]SUP40726.1 Holo-[acyl-carrier-protein] synthase [Veillonella criceti]
MKIGTDIIEIERIAKAVTKSHFATRVYTSQELAYATSRGKQRDASLAGMYAAKEAFVKALGTGFRDGSWQDLEVCRDKLGAPYMVLQGVFKDLYTSRGFTQLEVTISHCRTYAVATVLLQ